MADRYPVTRDETALSSAPVTGDPLASSRQRRGPGRRRVLQGEGRHGAEQRLNVDGLRHIELEARAQDARALIGSAGDRYSRCGAAALAW